MKCKDCGHEMIKIEIIHKDKEKYICKYCLSTYIVYSVYNYKRQGKNNGE
jgi:transposase-like protein